MVGAAVLACALCRLVFAQAVPAKLPDARDVINYLNQSINWHRQIAVEEQVASDPADVIYLDDNRQNASQILGLSFDFARADAQLLSTEGTPQSQNGSTGPDRYQSLRAAAQGADAELRQTQVEL